MPSALHTVDDRISAGTVRFRGRRLTQGVLSRLDRSVSWRLPKGWPQGEVPSDLARFGLGPRLARIASMVPRGKTVADIGTDHGLIPVALVGSGRCPRAVAIDRSEEPLSRAKRCAERFLVPIELRLGEGLLPGEAEVAVIAGLGGRAICSMVQSMEVETVVVQPNTDFEDVRRALASAGYRPTEERFVADDDRFFLVISAGRDQPRALSLAESFLGKVESDPLFEVWSDIQRTHLARMTGSADAALRLRLLGP
jgi:tRNA (adenine22-N1)-methyltransferase